MAHSAVIAALLVLSAVLVAEGSETCSSAGESVQSSPLLQVTHGIEDTRDQDPGHKLLLLAKQDDNGNWILPEKLRLMSQAQGTTRAHGTSSIPAEMQEMLDVHNMYRCMHGVPLLTWDAAIAAKAQEWVDNGEYKHSSRSARTLTNGQRLGENLAWGYPTRSGKDSVEAWYDEVVYTDGTPNDCGDRKADADGEPICHYTQVVWKASTTLGCAKGKADVLSYKDGDFWVCQYGPAGNMAGAFSDNVLAPVKTAEECSDPEPAPAPAPAPEITEETHSPTCKDGGAHEDPKITWSSSGELATCSDLAALCTPFPFVAAKCMKTCGSC